MSQSPQIDVNALWRYVTDQAKAKTNLPALWRAMEAARPITIENDVLVLGYSVADAHQSHLLFDNRFKNILEQILQAATHRRLIMQTIPGETLQDWELAKQHQAEAQRLQEQAREQYRKETDAGETWDAVGEQLVRRFSNTPHRGLASAQGRYLQDALDLLVEAYNRLMPETPEELDERNYSRALERVAERVNVPSSVIAYMVYQRVKR